MNHRISAQFLRELPDEELTRRLRPLPENYQQLLIRCYGLLGAERQPRPKVAQYLGVGQGLFDTMEGTALKWVQHADGEKARERPLQHLNLAPYLIFRLQRNGIFSVEDLQQRQETDLLEMWLMGACLVTQIRVALEEQGLSLATESHLLPPVTVTLGPEPAEDPGMSPAARALFAEGAEVVTFPAVALGDPEPPPEEVFAERVQSAGSLVGSERLRHHLAADQAALQEDLLDAVEACNWEQAWYLAATIRVLHRLLEAPEQALQRHETRE